MELTCQSPPKPTAMTLQEAIEYLRYYQSWKLDKQHQLLNPKKTTKALDMVLDASSALIEATKLMKDLGDLQNGPPLEQHRQEWDETMQEVYDFLNRWGQPTP
jgi:hypothetical protein